MDDGVEEFDISESDYNAAMGDFGGRRKRMSKNQATYGIWAEDENSSGEEGDSRGFVLGTHAKKSQKSAAGLGVNFVSGGVKNGDKVEKEEEKMEFDEEVQPQPAPRPQVHDYKHMAGMRSSSTGQKIGDWERHTKGIGAKLLSKMGYKAGKGLGKEGKGISEPIPVAKRPGRAAVGAYGPEVHRPPTQTKIGGKELLVEDENEEQQGAIPSGRWKKNQIRKPKYKFKTVEDVVAKGTMKQRSGVPHMAVKVIDMTGREQKEYQGYEMFSERTRAPTEVTLEEPKRSNFDIPDLRHNIDLLVEMAEEKIVRSDRLLKQLKDENVALVNDESQLNKAIESEEAQVSKLEQLLKILDEFNSKSKTQLMTNDECVSLFRMMQGDFYEEYKLYNLSAIAVTSVLPIVQSFFHAWDPLLDPDYGVEEMKTWRSLLEESINWTGAADLSKMDPYHRIVWEAWMPPFRSCASKWSPRNFEPMTLVLEWWMPVLPSWIFDNILDLIILPRLQTEVENWDPMTDTMPIHSWLHPWVPLMGDRLQPVYAPIRFKLGSALDKWHPSDPSAKHILQPWKGVFQAGSLESFIARHILPKLELYLSSFVVNPAAQKLDALHWLLRWNDLIGPNTTASVLLRHFFPKWYQALLTWLNCPNADMLEISNWYSGWKKLFPEDVLNVAAVRDQFSQALAVMNRAVSGGRVPTTIPTQMPPQPGVAAQFRPGMEFIASRNIAAPASFKDLIEKKAEESGLVFLPVPNRFQEGKPVYRFGPLNIYFDRTVIFHQTPAGWLPTALSDLVSKAIK